MSYLIVMPFTERAAADACMATMAESLHDHLLTIDNADTGRGTAASYNLAAAKVLSTRTDWLITVAPSIRFGPAGGLDFIAYLENGGAHGWVVEAAAPIGWHWMAWHRRMFCEVGVWDEYLDWPDHEDADFSYRIATTIAERRPWAPTLVRACDAWIAAPDTDVTVSDEHWSRYEQKWGGRTGQEKYRRPYNNAGNPLSYSHPPEVTHAR